MSGLSPPLRRANSDHDLLAGLRSLETRIKALTDRLGTLVAQSGTSLTEIPGVGATAICEIAHPGPGQDYYRRKFPQAKTLKVAAEHSTTVVRSTHHHRRTGRTCKPIASTRPK